MYEYVYYDDDGANELLNVAFICIRASCVYVQTLEYDLQSVYTHTHTHTFTPHSLSFGICVRMCYVVCRCLFIFLSHKSVNALLYAIIHFHIALCHFIAAPCVVIA